MIVLRKPKRSSLIAINKELSGAKDGSNKTFNTPSNYKSGQIAVKYNGQVLTTTDFLESNSNEIVLIYASPKDNETLTATYEIEV
jgi:hypothetical protein